MPATSYGVGRYGSGPYGGAGTLLTSDISRTGLTASYAAARSGGDSFFADQRTFLHVKNGGASSVTVTVATYELIDDDLPLSAVTVTVSAGASKMIGPFPGGPFDRTDGSGLADVTYSAVTSVTVAVLRLSDDTIGD